MTISEQTEQQQPFNRCMLFNVNSPTKSTKLNKNRDNCLVKARAHVQVDVFRFFCFSFFFLVFCCVLFSWFWANPNNVRCSSTYQLFRALTTLCTLSSVRHCSHRVAYQPSRPHSHSVVIVTSPTPKTERSAGSMLSLKQSTWNYYLLFNGMAIQLGINCHCW